jgi:hypothetical protein
MSTITGTVTHGVTITGSGSYTSPLTIAAGAAVSLSGSGAAVSSSILATVVDDGTVSAASSGGPGVILNAGGYVSLGTAGLIDASYGISISGAAGTVTNAGTIEATAHYGTGIEFSAGGSIDNTGLIEATARYGTGIELSAGGSIDNTGLIEATGYGGSGVFSSGPLSNSGTIEATGYRGRGVDGATIDDTGLIEAIGSQGYGVVLVSGGYLSLGTAGIIEAYYRGVSTGIHLLTQTGSLLARNAGTIEATGTGGVGIFINLSLGGTVANAGTIEATGKGGVGIDFAFAGGTVVDSGLISGTTAVAFGGTGSNLLELEAGYSISGSIVGSGSATNTLELSGTLGAVSVSYNSLGLSHFGFVDFAAPTGSNNETLVIANTAALPGTIEGFTAFHDIIDLTGFTYHSGASVTETGDVLTIVSGSETLTMNLAGNYPSLHWQAVKDSGTGTEIEPACFARGTMILTENGEYPVEDLSIGNRVVTLAGDIRPIKWIGRRSYRGAFLLRNSDMWPIRVAAGALGPDVPRRDLYLSAKHALFLDGLLYPVECLVNGRSITRCACPDEIEYFHIELDTHDVILAEGAPAETFVDCDDRMIFHNAREFALLYPGEEPPRWHFCARRVEAGHELDRVRARLLARASRAAA